MPNGMTDNGGEEGTTPFFLNGKRCFLKKKK